MEVENYPLPTTNDRRVLGQILIRDGVITPAQLEQALAQQRSSGVLLGEILLSLNFVTEEALARAGPRSRGALRLD